MGIWPTNRRILTAIGNRPAISDKFVVSVLSKMQFLGITRDDGSIWRIDSQFMSLPVSSSCLTQSFQSFGGSDHGEIIGMLWKFSVFDMFGGCSCHFVGVQAANCKLWEEVLWTLTLMVLPDLYRCKRGCCVPQSNTWTVDRCRRRDSPFLKKVSTVLACFGDVCRAPLKWPVATSP